MPNRIRPEDLIALAETAGFSAQWTTDVIGSTVTALREAWRGEVRNEAARRSAPLEQHYTSRLGELAICLNV